MPFPIYLNDNQINAICQQVVSYCYSYDKDTWSLIQTMYRIGCREGEVTAFNRWQINTDGTMILRCIKRGGFRTFTTTDFSNEFISALQNYENRGTVKSTRQLRVAFNKFSPIQKLYCKEKEISCHLFRHNRMKQLFNEGYSLDWMADYFALSSSEVPDYYVKSLIYYYED